MSGINGINSNAHHQADPRDLFSRTDSDKSGGVSQAELKNLAGAIAEKTGIAIDSGSEAFKGYDSDTDGSLSGEELRAVLDNSGFGPPMGMQGVAPPPPPLQQAVGSYSDNQSESGKDVLSALVSKLQGLLDLLTSDSPQPDSGAQSGTAPQDIFGKVDTDRSGSLSMDELEALAESLKESTGQTLNISGEAVSALDKNGDGELTPDEIDLRATLALKSADLTGDPAAKDLRTSLDSNWLNEQQGAASGPAVSATGPDSPDPGTLLERINEVKTLLTTLSKFLDSSDGSSDSHFSVKS